MCAQGVCWDILIPLHTPGTTSKSKITSQEKKIKKEEIQGCHYLKNGLFHFNNLSFNSHSCFSSV